LVEFLAAWPRPARLLLLCLMRPELLQEQPRLADLLRSACVDLQPLDQDESDAMLQHLTAQRPLPARARARIRDAAEGNPLFLEQLLAMLTDRPGPNPAVGLPPTITALLAARLDRLGPGERAVLERAAVVGRVFHRDVVAALLPVQARPTVDRHLAGLVARDLLAASAPHEVAATHAFRHGLVQSAVYSGTPIETRATLHESVAQLLDQDGTGQDELVGHHLAEAHRSRVELGIRNNHTTALARAAARRLRTAGAQAHSRGDMPTAAALLDRARNLGEDDDVEALEILPDLGYALFEVGELTRAEQVLLDAERRTGAAGAHGLRWRATVTRLHLGIYLSPSAVDIDPMVREAAEAETFLAAAGDDVGLARALMLRSDLDFMRGRSGAALAAMRRGLRHARRAGARREEAWCMGQLGFALMAGETPVDRGLAQCARTLRETVGNPVARANLLPFLAVHEAMRGDFASARVHAAEGRTATRELGLRWQDGIHLLLSGYVELSAGDPVMAEWHLREAAQSFAEVGDEWFARTAAVDLSRALLEQGRPDDARGAIGTAATDLPDAELQIKHRSLLAVLMAQETPSKAAVDCAREAVQIAETTDLVTWHAAAQLDLAEVLSRCGDRSGAADAGEAARLLFARKGHVAGERRAQQRLTSLVPTGA
jgi:tetratricopeptide (TPR) repeat protein